MKLPLSLSNTIDFNVGNLQFAPAYWQAGAIVVLIFLLILTLAQVRRHFVHWSFKGSIFGIFLGFLLALILEGFLIIGGKTAITELLGWKNAPKPVSTALDKGRENLVNVLGVTTDDIPSSNAYSDPTSDDAIKLLQSLNPSDMKKVKGLICNP